MVGQLSELTLVGRISEPTLEPTPVSRISEPTHQALNPCRTKRHLTDPLKPQAGDEAESQLSGEKNRIV